MHEISLIRQVFRTLEEQFSEEELTRLKTIQLRIGLLANVEPTLLRNAYEAVLATDQQQHKEVNLKVELVPIEIECPQCNKRSEVKEYRFVCLHCGHLTNNVVQGTELLISGVELHEAVG